MSKKHAPSTVFGKRGHRKESHQEKNRQKWEDRQDSPNPKGNGNGNSEHRVECMKLEGFDACVLGVATRGDGMTSLAYDMSKVIAQISTVAASLDPEGIIPPEQEVRTFIGTNFGKWFGPGTPVFVEVMPLETIEEVAKPITSAPGAVHIDGPTKIQ